MAHGKNAQGKGYLIFKEFSARRPMDYFNISKANKRLCHRIERARERELILDELRKLIAFEGGFNV